MKEAKGKQEIKKSGPQGNAYGPLDNFFRN